MIKLTDNSTIILNEITTRLILNFMDVRSKIDGSSEGTLIAFDLFIKEIKNGAGENVAKGPGVTRKWVESLGVDDYFLVENAVQNQIKEIIALRNRQAENQKKN